MTCWEPATVNVEVPDSPAIGDVVATVDESTYEPYPGEMGGDHPTAS